MRETDRISQQFRAKAAEFLLAALRVSPVIALAEEGHWHVPRPRLEPIRSVLTIKGYNFRERRCPVEQ
jgi:hypothetical protein